jgi:hypothetical protein
MSCHPREAVLSVTVEVKPIRSFRKAGTLWVLEMIRGIHQFAETHLKQVKIYFFERILKVCHNINLM